MTTEPSNTNPQPSPNSIPDREGRGGSDREPIDWGRLLRRKDRPLPPKGCSIAFYVFLIGLFIFLAVLYIQHR